MDTKHTPMTEQEPPVQTPTTIEGMSIHLGYIRRDLDSMNKKLDGLSTSFVTTTEFNDHLKGYEDHEKRIRILEGFKDTLLGKLWGVGIMAGGVVAIISILVNHFWK